MFILFSRGDKVELRAKETSILEQDNYMDLLRDRLTRKNMLDRHNNLNLEDASEEDFLDMFFNLKVFNKDKEPSKHTIRAYKQDLQTIFSFLTRHKQTFRDIDFVVVKTFNREMREMYANRSAVRRLDFMKRILDFGYITHFYKTPLAPWIEKPSVSKGHYSDKKLTSGEIINRTEYRELSEEEAVHLISFFPKVVRTKRYREQYILRNTLLGVLLLQTGMRSSEVLGLRWGSFRETNRGKLVVDVIGKGNKQRTIPIFDDVQVVLFDYRLSLGDSVVINKRDTTPLFYNIEHYDQYEEKKPLAYTTLFRIVKSAVDLSGLDEHISPHWLRHSYCTTLLGKNVALSVVKQVMGHSNISTTNIYLERLKEDSVYDAFEKAGY